MNQVCTVESSKTMRVSMEPVRLAAAALVSYEFVFSMDDFMVFVNGDCVPSACESFHLDGNGSFVWSLVGGGELVSEPMPADFQELVATVPSVLFVRFGATGLADAQVLLRTS